VKVNIFVPTKNGGKFTDNSIPHSSITGVETGEPASPEDEIINAIDERKMSPEKFTAVKFLEFLANHRIKIEDLKNLSPQRQSDIRREFLQG
jgi:hypothetical protein